MVAQWWILAAFIKFKHIFSSRMALEVLFLNGFYTVYFFWFAYRTLRAL